MGFLGGRHEDLGEKTSRWVKESLCLEEFPRWIYRGLSRWRRRNAPKHSETLWKAGPSSVFFRGGGYQIPKGDTLQRNRRPFNGCWGTARFFKEISLRMTEPGRDREGAVPQNTHRERKRAGDSIRCTRRALARTCGSEWFFTP